MEPWVELVLTVIVVLFIPFGAWLVTKIIKLEVEIAKINERCVARLEWIESISEVAARTLSNIIKIAAKLDVEIKE